MSASVSSDLKALYKCIIIYSSSSYYYSFIVLVHHTNISFEICTTHEPRQTKVLGKMTVKQVHLCVCVCMLQMMMMMMILIVGLQRHAQAIRQTSTIATTQNILHNAPRYICSFVRSKTLAFSDNI